MAEPTRPEEPQYIANTSSPASPPQPPSPRPPSTTTCEPEPQKETRHDDIADLDPLSISSSAHSPATQEHHTQVDGIETSSVPSQQLRAEAASMSDDVAAMTGTTAPAPTVEISAPDASSSAGQAGNESLEFAAASSEAAAKGHGRHPSWGSRNPFLTDVEADSESGAPSSSGSRAPALPPRGAPSPAAVSQGESANAQLSRPVREQGQRPQQQQQQAEAEWGLKSMLWPPILKPGQRRKWYRIVTQNENGPCSLIALCNILILRDEIHIHPADRPTVTYSILSGLLADYLIRLLSDPDRQVPGVEAPSLDAVLAVLPTTQYGLDVNVRFTSTRDFGALDATTAAPASGQACSAPGTAETALFALAGIPLVHGWVCDPQDWETWEAVCTPAPGAESGGDYDSACGIVAAGDSIAGGLVVAGDAATEAEVERAVEQRRKWTDDDRAAVARSMIVRQFLDSTSTQLTYAGLVELGETLGDGELCALFRNSHLSVLYRKPRDRTADANAAVPTSSPQPSNSASPAPPSQPNQFAPPPGPPPSQAPSSTTYAPPAGPPPGAAPTAQAAGGPPPPIYAAHIAHPTTPLQRPEAASLGGDPLLVENARHNPALPALFTLVTDIGLSDEPNVVWESLVDTDGAGAEWFDARLARAVPRNDGSRRRRNEGRRQSHGQGQRTGDRRRDDERREAENVAAMSGNRSGVIDEDADLALAISLQEEEERELREQSRAEDRRRQGGPQRAPQLDAYGRPIRYEDQYDEYDGYPRPGRHDRPTRPQPPARPVGVPTEDNVRPSGKKKRKEDCVVQ